MGAYMYSFSQGFSVELIEKELIKIRKHYSQINA